MINNQESELSKSIRRNMQLKDSDELLAIWIKNDRQEWSDETFSIVHEILLERLGNVPAQKVYNPKSRRNQKAKIPSVLILIFSPAILVLLLIILIPAINPGPSDQWFTVLFFASMALFFFLPGFYFGWKSWFQGEQVKQRVRANLPDMKKSFLYGLYTYFLPDRLVPTYFLILARFISVVLIYGGVKMILLLIEEL